jgi:hypothetical protein
MEAAPENQGRHTWEGAKVVIHELEINGYNDWRLPTEKELDRMYEDLHLKGIGGFYNSYYWGSSSNAGYDSLLRSFSDGKMYISESNKEKSFLVHAVRAF